MMDPGELIALVGMAIPVAAIVMGGLQKVARIRLEETQNSEEVQALRNELENVRQELSELSERVDFAERLLARGRTPDATQKEVRPRP